jgi:hypothetical protein
MTAAKDVKAVVASLEAGGLALARQTFLGLCNIRRLSPEEALTLAVCARATATSPRRRPRAKR